MSGIQVGVRVRCFLPRIDGEDQCCVTMTDTQTIMNDVHGEGGEKKFTFTKTEGEELNDFWQKQGGHF